MDANGTMAVSGDRHVELKMTITSQVRLLWWSIKWKSVFVSRWKPSRLTPALTCRMEWNSRIWLTRQYIAMIKLIYELIWFWADGLSGQCLQVWCPVHILIQRQREKQLNFLWNTIISSLPYAFQSANSFWYFLWFLTLKNLLLFFFVFHSFM